MTVVAIEVDPLGRQVLAAEHARGSAHESFLRGADGLAQTMSNHLAFQMALIEALMAAPGAEGATGRLDRQRAAVPPRSARRSRGPGPIEPPAEESPRAELPFEVPRSLNREQCLEFAVGSIGRVLGKEFAPIDAQPTRVRLPDEPLMLVDRILRIEGEPRSMTRGRVVTEHDINPGAWYLDAGKIPTCIAVESGQADLFLSGFLGIDFITRGQAVYRLLDATVTFHAPLPGPGKVIQYDIHIDRFFRQGDTHLFRFRFEATVDGEPLLSMRDGCAGFFTEGELASGKGLVFTDLQRQAQPGRRPDDWRELVPQAVEAYSDAQVDALRQGDLVSAFGPHFEGLPLTNPIRLPGGRMTLVHRVVELNPGGGRFGLGSIRARADIHLDDWFMTCHFVDDRVMPGTLMYECCLHTLRIQLMRLGWLAEEGMAAWEPIPGVTSRLRCRGQVIEGTRQVEYEVVLKEVGYRPEPYAIADAFMYADGKPIVEITDMSVQLSGQTREGVERLWAGRAASSPPATKPGKQATYDKASILAFAIGKPSEAFGEKYRVFDEERFIARLPGPPYDVLDRITSVEAEPWKVAAGGWIEAQYDVPPDAWYFAADRQPRMPFAVLLEVALQPCGWFAAYMGSALTRPEPLHFRNLGGKAVQLLPVTPDTGTLTIDVTSTRAYSSGGMLIQHYDFHVHASGSSVYRGETNFGFFSRTALANQVGIREAKPYEPSPTELDRARLFFPFPDGPPFPDSMWRMLDRVDLLDLEGGPHGLGFAQGVKQVDPSEWFFKAHFYQDPVCPGSLGLESFLQLLKLIAAERWGASPDSVFESLGLGDTHQWTYRGQVIPSNRLVTVQALITAIDDNRRWLKADGWLSVDGLLIYHMKDFSLRLA